MFALPAHVEHRKRFRATAGDGAVWHEPLLLCTVCGHGRIERLNVATGVQEACCGEILVWRDSSGGLTSKGIRSSRQGGTDGELVYHISLGLSGRQC